MTWPILGAYGPRRCADLVSHDRTFMYHYCIIFLSLALQGLHLCLGTHGKVPKALIGDLELSRKAVSIDGRTDRGQELLYVCLAMLALSGRPHD
jgi:hypothetical protein